MKTSYDTFLTGSTLALAVSLALTLVTGQAAAQTYNVIYTFTGHGTSAHPIAGVLVDPHGNLFGTSAWGGTDTPGDVYELQRTGSGFNYSELYIAGLGTKGNFPWDPPVLGPGGMYVTMNGGGSYGDGTVLKVQPSATLCRSVSCLWNTTDLYDFSRRSDGGNSEAAVVFDTQGNMYGTAPNGGTGYGVVFEMTSSKGKWIYQIIYTFTGGEDGAFPAAPLFVDAAGNLYGTAESGGLPGCGNYGCGTIFKLSRSGASWSETVLHSFENGPDGAAPTSGLIADKTGSFYGATAGSDISPGGTVYQLIPSGDGWTFNLIYDLPGTGGGPFGNLVRDSAGNLYGATWGDGAHGQGNVFKLSPTSNGWIYTNIHDFTDGPDGGNANGGLAIDNNGVIYGTTYDGGSDNCLCGVVFQITP
jgi:uncharacterized repeat protein (TIGR03803 family)